jgi:hypothetical protein
VAAALARMTEEPAAQAGPAEDFPKPAWWPSWLEAPAAVAFRLRIVLASGLAGAGLVDTLAGFLGQDGIGVDRLINLDAAFRTEGLLWLGASALVLPWKGIRRWFQTKDRWLVRRQNRPVKAWAGLPVLFLTVPGLFVGVLQAEMHGLRQVISTITQQFDTYQAQKEELNQIFEVDSEGVSHLPPVLAHDAPACQLFRSHLTVMAAQPTTALGQVLNNSQTTTGYERGCLTDQELFIELNGFRARAAAWSSPHFTPVESMTHASLAQNAGMTADHWCILTREWPVNTPFGLKEVACEEVGIDIPLDHPVTLKSLGVDVPDAATIQKAIDVTEGAERLTRKS